MKVSAPSGMAFELASTTDQDLINIDRILVDL